MAFLVAPLLFACLPDRTVAGDVARHLFVAVEYLGLGCGLLLMMLNSMMSGRWLADTGARLVSIMLILTALSLLVINPWLEQLRLADGAGSSVFAWGHALASLVYVLLCLLALWLVLKDPAMLFRAG